MNATQNIPPRRPAARPLSAYLAETVESATRRIAPTWPLDRFIAVNPLWGFVDRPLTEAAARVTSLSGARLTMPRSYYRAAWRSGRFTRRDLEAAITQTGAPTSVEQLEAELGAVDEPEREDGMLPHRALVSDVVDAGRDLVHEMSWRELITEVVSQHCAAQFDGGQAGLRAVGDRSLWSRWRKDAEHDRRPGLLMGFGRYAELVRSLPTSRNALFATAAVELDIEARELESYLTAALLDISGWAAWCAYRRWEAELHGGTDDAIVDLLAIRLAWELLLLRSGGDRLRDRWQVAMAGWVRADARAMETGETDWLLQRALEVAYQRPIIEGLPAGLDAERPAPRVQAAFCIDVRSEVFRRALEAESDDVQTLGFAGFFGLPVEYQPLGAPSARPQLPGLLAPKMRVADQGLADGAADQRQARLDLGEAWARLKSNAVSGFSYVESLGLLYGAKLLGDALGHTRPTVHPESAGLRAAERAGRKPRLDVAADGTPLTGEAKADLAAGILGAMSLKGGLARVVALVGHGSQTANNPHAGGYDCGACCGQAGDVNARATAALLNDPDVRHRLAERGVDVPGTTWFVPALHDTTTDQVTLFDQDEVPESHREDLAELRRVLDGAAARARRERAARLAGVPEEGSDEQVRRAVDARARDWSEVRPEWGLAGNASFIVAPREHVAHLDLGGRAFLHDYRQEEDEGFGVLELIMTAPMVVTHWINFQYYASTVDNRRFGSGNKVLHDVVGGHVGVFEGNGGDLRIGLPLQSLHDGTQWVHEPLRLSVFLEAPRYAIDEIIAKHDLVRQLVENEWIHLFQIDRSHRAVHARRVGGWVPNVGSVPPPAMDD